MQYDWFQHLLTPYYLIASLMIVVAVCGLCTCIIKLLQPERTDFVYIFTCYFSCVIIQGLVIPVDLYLNTSIDVEIFNLYSESLFANVEFIVFCLLFQKILISSKYVHLVKMLAISYPICYLLYYYWGPSSAANHYSLSVIGAFILLGVCLVYFYELFLHPPTKILTREPSFWTATGILIY